MPATQIRLHRYPWIDAAALVVTLGTAFALFHLTDSHPAHLEIAPDSTRFRPDSAYGAAELLAEGFGARVTGTESATRAAAWIRGRFDAVGLVTEEQDFPLTLRGRAVRGRNIVARSGGTIPGAIVLLAHYDGQQTSSQSAGDNAAGVGTLLELARVLELRGHRRPIIYVATDAKEYGSIGAARFAARITDPADIVAAISLDHVSAGASAYVSLDGTSQGVGFTPLWLRHAAAEAYAAVGTRTEDAGRAAEWFSRTIRLSTGDQGPLIARNIPAINLGVEAENEIYAKFIYHTPGDRVETLDTTAFRRLGQGAERLIRAIDRAERIEGPRRYFEIEEGHVTPGTTVLVAAILLFLPLAWSTVEAVIGARGAVANRRLLAGEALRAASWWLTGLGGLVALRLLARTPLLPRYELYPATVRDPFVYQVRWGPIVLLLVALVALAALFAWLRRRLGFNGGHPLAGRVAALVTLLLLATIATIVNPFAAIMLLVLPAWLWPWVGPTARPIGGARGAALVVLSALPFLVIPLAVAAYFEIGPKVGWYMIMQAAYGAWSPLSVVMLAVAAFAAWRLMGTATSRIAPVSGD